MKKILTLLLLLFVSIHAFAQYQDVTNTLSAEEKDLLWECESQARRNSYDREFRTGRVEFVYPIPKSKIEMFFGSKQEVWIYKKEYLSKDLKFINGQFYETGTTTKMVTYLASSMPWNSLLPVNDGNGPDPVPKVNKRQNFSCTWDAVTMQMKWGYYTANVRKETFFPKLN